MKTGYFKTIYIALLLWMSLPLFLLAGEVVIEAKVRDNNTHREISGVNISVPEKNIGATTNASGRFSLKIRNPRPALVVIFEHVAYDTLKLSFAQISELQNIYMQERVIPLPAVEVETAGERLEIEKDLPQTVSVLNSRNFELKGYVDAGDLLRTDHSVQVDEQLSGKKTVSIRGGNPDEVVVLYDGIKLNSPLDNVFDMSLINLQDIERFEVIKGSNTSLYGSEAFSGVINIIPKTEQDYKARFQQRIGSYDSGDWGLNLYENFKRLYGSYSIKKSGARRRYSGEPSGRNKLENLAEHHTASLAYNLSETPSGAAKSSLGGMYIRTELDYQNERDNEFLNNFNQLLSARFDGNIGPISNINLSLAYQWLQESQFYNLSAANASAPPANGERNYLDREIDNRSFHLNIEKSFDFHPVELLLAYQQKNSLLDFHDERIISGETPLGLEAAELHRKNYGFVAIGKYRGPSGSDFYNTLDFDLSFRFDRVEDRQGKQQFRAGAIDSTGFFRENNWDEATIKFSTYLSGRKENLDFQAYMNYGTNVKFPTLQQQISTPKVFTSELTRPNLDPEKNRSLEIGTVITKEIREDAPIFGWQISANVFKNWYENKMRVYYSLGLPLAVYDNIKIADISGLEAKPGIFLFKKKLTIEFGISRYYFSEMVTFPFKYDTKQTLNIFLDHRGYSLQLYAFNEGKQVGLLRNFDFGYSKIELPAYTNLDFHISKTFEINKFNLIFNASFRNILDNDLELDGLALRDRRYYFTLGIEY